MATREFKGFDRQGLPMLVKLSYDGEWEEFVAKVWINDKRYEPADYHTNDREDAINTCKKMVNNKARVGL